MALRITRKNRILVSSTVHPEYRQVIKTYTKIDGNKIIEIPYNDKGVTDLEKLSDAVDGVLNMIDGGEGFRIYNIGESQTITLQRLVRLIEETLGKKALIRQLPDQPGDVPRTYADITRARKEIGYRPGVSIEEGLKRFIDWYLKEGPGKAMD